MKTNRLHRLVATVSLGVLVTAVGAGAEPLGDVLRAGEARVSQAQASQQAIDRMAGDTVNLQLEYQKELKLLDDLRTYNRKLAVQVEHQAVQMASIEKATQEVTVTQRRIQPLAERMLDTLEQFVKLDLPFHDRERQQRISAIRAGFDNPDLSPAEKFRQVLDAYKIENAYGSKIEAYADTFRLDGQDREVDVLRVGRLALMYQTADARHAGVWDRTKKSWVELPAEYRGPLAEGIRMARRQAPTGLLVVPVSVSGGVK